MASEEFVIALTTFPLDADAEAFARTLVEERFDWWKLGDRLHEAIAARGLL